MTYESMVSALRAAKRQQGRAINCKLLPPNLLAPILNMREMAAATTSLRVVDLLL